MSSAPSSDDTTVAGASDGQDPLGNEKPDDSQSAAQTHASPDHDLAEIRQPPFVRRWNFWGLTLYQVILPRGMDFQDREHHYAGGVG